MLFSKISAKLLSILFFVVVIPFAAFAQQNTEIKLPAPNKTGGMPLMDALSNRKSSRDFSEKELSNQQLSDLLWAMWGINRADGRRTAPTARNWQELDLYIVKKDGIYKYDAKKNVLELVKSGDNRKIAGTQDFVQKAALNILLVADFKKMGNNETDNMMTANIDAGFVCQNAYLYCASEKLKCVVRMMIDRDEIKKVLGFGNDMYPVIAVTVGN
jgi:SagB-type dehydrogenase family enzyme